MNALNVIDDESLLSKRSVLKIPQTQPKIIFSSKFDSKQDIFLKQQIRYEFVN